MKTPGMIFSAKKFEKIWVHQFFWIALRAMMLKLKDLLNNFIIFDLVLK